MTRATKQPGLWIGLAPIAVMRREGGKPEVDAIVEIAGAIDHVHWASNNARRVLRSRLMGRAA